MAKSKHREAIEALEPFVNAIKTCQENIEVADPDMPVRITVLVSELKEADSVVSSWYHKQNHPKLRQRIRCKTCRVPNYYENLNPEGRCSFCEQALRDYVLNELSEERQEERKVEKQKKKNDSDLNHIAEEIRKLNDNEINQLLAGLNSSDAQFVRGILKSH